jgi:hypothetical protein
MKSERINPLSLVDRLEALDIPTSDRAWIEELMWFAQAVGGGRCLAIMIVEAFPDRLVTAPFCDGRKKISRGAANDFWKEVSAADYHHFKDIVPRAFTEELSLGSILDGHEEDPRWEQERRKGLPELDAAAVCEVVHRIAVQRITKQIEALFKEKSAVEPALDTFEDIGHPLRERDLLNDCWAFKDLQGTLKEFLSRHAAETQKKVVAATAVVEKVFDALDFAWEEGVMVMIEGDPRHGKTEAINAYCAMYPGRARLVTIPSESTDLDFFMAIAEALQIPMEGPSCNVGDLRRRIDHVLKKARLMLIFDEFHFAIPQQYSATTAPKRMNWIRTRVCDRGLPTALLITPQSFDEAFRKFARKTRHRFDQFFGRTARFALPATLSRSDVIAVAEKHFPEIDRDYLGLIAGRAMQCQPGADPAGRIQPGFLHGIKVTASRARHLAKRAGRPGSITEEDVMRAMDEQMPIAAPKKGVCKEPAPAPQTRRTEAPERLSRASHNDSPSRFAAEELAA